MKALQLSGGTVHELPKDLVTTLLSDQDALEQWESLTPLARNEWICWVTNVKLAETRQKHLDRVITDLLRGKRRPCCWQGCSHREKNGR